MKDKNSGGDLQVNKSRIVSRGKTDATRETEKQESYNILINAYIDQDIFKNCKTRRKNEHLPQNCILYDPDNTVLVFSKDFGGYLV